LEVQERQDRVEALLVDMVAVVMALLLAQVVGMLAQVVV